MRTLRTLALLVMIAGVGAVLAVRWASADGASRQMTGSAPAAAARTAPAPPATSHGAPIRLWVRDRAGRRLLSTTVGAVDPVTGPSGFRPVDPPAWDQAVWVRYRPLVPPTDTAHGTSYVYGHACHHHVCSFTELARVRPGDSVVVQAGGRVTSYVVTMASANFPKAGPGSLSDRTSGVADRALSDRLVLITCAYEQGDVSLNNFVVIARRVHTRRRA